MGRKKATVHLSFCTFFFKFGSMTSMYFLPNEIWQSKDFSPLAQFSLLKEDTLAVFSAYNPVICNDLANISTWLSQHQFKFTSSIIFLPTLLFLLLPIPVIMLPFTKQRILDSLNFVAFFLTVCLTCIHLFPKCFCVYFHWANHPAGY